MRMLTLFTRTKPGVSVDASRNEINGLIRELRPLHPDAYPKHEKWGARAVSLRDEFAARGRTTFWLLFAATGLVLVIACANVANLTIARSMHREREIAIRSALGAGRGRLLQQFLVEGILVSLAGGLLG